VAALPAGVYTVLLEGSEARAHARMVKPPGYASEDALPPGQ
jgi:hypothetical protein